MFKGVLLVAIIATWLPEEVLQKLKLCICANQTRIVEALRPIFPQIAQGFFKQRGNVFGFGDFHKDSAKLFTKQDLEKLDEAPINNFDSKRSGGSINCELKTREANQIVLGSVSDVKAKFRDLIELKPKDEFKKYYKTGWMWLN